MINSSLIKLRERVEEDYDVPLASRSQKRLDVEARACFIYIAKIYLKIDYDRISKFTGMPVDTCKSSYYKLCELMDVDDMVKLRVNYSLKEFKKSFQSSLE
jgi:hypothetical protein